MQAISREVLLSKGLPSELELRKGSEIPHWFTQVTSSATPHRAWWQVYLDNFMSAEVSDKQPSGINVGLQEQAMRAWDSAGILIAKDKQVLGEKEVTELGVRIDGTAGLLGGSPERLTKTILATIHFLINSHWSKREAQIILGRWIFLLQYRRAAMGVLSNCWEVLTYKWPSLNQLKVVHGELLTLICMGPLLQTDLTSPYDGEVTCSDASESGGAAAVSTALSWSGRSLVGRKEDLRLRPIECPVLLISLFNGIGGTFRIYDILGIQPAGRISVDISRHANRVTRTTWPDVIELHDINDIDLQEIKRWASLFPHISELHLFAGFPCVHLSSARAFRENLDGPCSNLFWKLLEILADIQAVFSRFCKVKFCIENVASMDEDARHAISSALEICPIKLDPSDSLPVSRPRFAWCSETLYEMEGLELWTEKDYVRAYTSADPVSDEQWIRPGWTWGAPTGTCFPTFMKSIRRKTPPPKPAGLARTDEEARQRWRMHDYRYPPYQYKSQFLLHHSVQPSRLLDSSERELLLGFGAQHTASCMSASEMKKSKMEYEDVRCSLCGDSFSIFSFAIMAGAMCSEFSPRMSPDRIIKRLGLAPGCSVHPSIEVPLTRKLAYGGNVERPHTMRDLVQHLALTVNHTG